MKKPSFEAIKPNLGQSFSSLIFKRDANVKSHVWHYHPEVELISVFGGSGKRQIGSSISYFSEGDLVLIGSQLPHCGFTDEQTLNDHEVVIQFLPEFLGSDLWQSPEFAAIEKLLNKAAGGLVFGEKTKNILQPKIFEMQKTNGFQKLIIFLEILNELANTNDFQILNAGSFLLQTKMEDNDRINLIFNYVKDHFRENISLPEVADLANMTEPSFCRYFKKVTSKTFTQFVNEYRIAHAMKLLAEEPTSITNICYECGFNNFSYFNKTFKTQLGKSPSQYRKSFGKIFD